MKDLELITQALQKANQRGVFTLEESAVIFNAIQLHEREYQNLFKQSQDKHELKEAKVKKEYNNKESK